MARNRNEIRMTNGQTTEARLRFSEHFPVTEVLCRIQTQGDRILLTFNGIAPDGIIIEDTITVRIEPPDPWGTYAAPDRRPQYSIPEQAILAYQEQRARQMRDNVRIGNIRLDPQDRQILGTTTEPEHPDVEFAVPEPSASWWRRQGRSFDRVVIDDIPQPTEETYREDHYEEGEEQDDPSLSLEPDQG